MRKVKYMAKNTDSHIIYPNFRGFYNEEFKKDVREIKLKEEYRCSKCGAKIKIDNYEKNKKRSCRIQAFIIILSFVAVSIFDNIAEDAFVKIFLNYYEVQGFLLWFLNMLFCFVVVVIPTIVVMFVVLWLERVIFLKRYCAKLQKNGTNPCVGKEIK